MDAQEITLEQDVHKKKLTGTVNSRSSKESHSNGWRLVKLSEVCKNTELVNPFAYPEKPFDYIDVSSVSNDSYCIVETRRILGKNAPSRARKSVQTDDVIFATVRPTLKRVAMIPSELNGQVCSTGFCVLRANFKDLEPQFLYFLLLTEFVNQRVESLQKGATYPAINDSNLFNLLIPLPPISEQDAIARFLQRLQDAIKTRQDELNLERERKSALMDYLFTHGTSGNSVSTKMTRFGSVPVSWKLMPLEQCAFVQTGIAKGRKFTDNHTINLPYLRVANVQDGYLDLTEIKYIKLRESEVERYKLQPDDVVVTEGGDFDKLGRGFLWKGQITDCVHQNHIFAVRVNHKILKPEYFAYLIQSNYGKAYFLSVAHRTTNLASINSTKLKAFPAIVPSLQEQKDIVIILNACDTEVTALEQEVELLAELFRALLEELMTGRLSTLPLIEKGETHE